MRKINLLLDDFSTHDEMKFAVELSQLIGFFSLSMEFPFIHRSSDTLDPDILYFQVGGKDPISGNIVRVEPGDSPAAVWADIFKEYMSEIHREVRKPAGYVSATENARSVTNTLSPKASREEENTWISENEKLKGGLELMFEKGWLLKDTDGDGISDFVDCRILLNENMTRSECCAACCIAAKFGMETVSIRYPLVSDMDDGQMNVIKITGRDRDPSISVISEEPRIIIDVDGRGEALEDFLNCFSNSFPKIEYNLRLKDAVCHLRNSLRLMNQDGQAAWLAGKPAKKALLSRDADICAFRKRWPKTEFHHFNDSFVTEERSYPLGSEMITVKSLLLQITDEIKPGDIISLTGAIGQNREVRDILAHEFTEKAAERGAADIHVSIVCAYKQGLSWLEEKVGPKLAKLRDLNNLVIRFQPGQTTSVTYYDTEFDWKKESEKASKPPRWLRDIYPADELVAEIAGISRDKVTFEPCKENTNATYVAEAFDKAGRMIFRDEWTVRCSVTPYFKKFPKYGPSIATTGFLQVVINGRTILDSRIVTDYERIWDTFRERVLPWAEDVAKKKGLSQENQPFFSKIELSIGLNGPERTLKTRNDHISVGETLEDSIHLAGRAFFLHLGIEKTGQSFSAPGLFEPHIRIRRGAPEFRAKLYMPYGSMPSFPKLSGECSCSKVTSDGRGLSLTMECIQDSRAEGLVKRIASLTEEGFTNFGRMLSGYDSVTFVINGKSVRCALPPMQEQLEPIDIRQIDISEDEVIGYNRYLEIINSLSRVRGLKVYPVAMSVQGRIVYAIEPDPCRRGYTSDFKRIQVRPTLLINGRHHANEVSATNAIFSFIKRLLSGNEFEKIINEVNLIFIPMENVDGSELHYKMQKEHPDWQHQVSYINSIGADLMPFYFKSSPLSPESEAFTRVSKALMPDAFIDLHGVPHHDISPQFSGISGYCGLWLPRSPLCAFYYHIDDERFSSNKALSLALKQRVDNALSEWDGFNEVSKEYAGRFSKYSWDGIDETYPCQFNGAMLDYWIPSPYDPNFPYPTISLPWIFSLMLTAEAADETAHGEWLSYCEKAHMRHLAAALTLMRKVGLVIEKEVEVKDGEAMIKVLRHRPVVPPETANHER